MLLGGRNVKWLYNVHPLIVNLTNISLILISLHLVLRILLCMVLILLLYVMNKLYKHIIVLINFIIQISCYLQNLQTVYIKVYYINSKS